ncbi:MAG: hypothetical protein LQ350_008339 [Teloschistes chrysophthalmus]|nr:MAG: hypothetical protein LQ350_008339 [Niorma chrysophthalma]
MLRSLALFALWATSALAAVPAIKETFVRCGTDNPSPELQAAANAMGARPVPLAAQTLNVRTYFHVVTTQAAQGSITQSQLNDQLAVLNRSYGPSGISFTLISSDFTTNDQWATGNYDSTMKPALRKGTYADLNVYFLSDLGGGLLGICNFPTNASPGSSTYNQDGCDVLAQSVPGGTATNYNQGGSATHEIGHWFGLFHVFQGQACSGSGDSGIFGANEASPPQVIVRYEQLEVAAIHYWHIMSIFINGAPLSMNMDTVSDEVRKVRHSVHSMDATVNAIGHGIDVLGNKVETIQGQIDERFDNTSTDTNLQFHRLQNITRNRLCTLEWEKIYPVTTADRSGRNFVPAGPDTVDDF